MKHLALILVLALALSSTHAIAAERTASTSPSKRDALIMTLSANLAPEPAQVSVRMRLEPDPRSRLLLIEWWSADGVGGSHTITVEGERAATRQEYPIKQMQAGEYVVSAVLVRNDGTQVKRTARMMVVGERALSPAR
jgi:hypothetical protein